MIAEVLGIVSLTIWLYLLACRGGFWRIHFDQIEPRKGTTPAQAVAAVVPARNEAGVVGRAVTSLLTQDFEGRLHVFLTDDDSSDATTEAAQLAAEEAGQAAHLTILRAGPRPPGWTGKVWAQAEGLRAAASFGADYFLLTDADIVHGPGVLAELVSRAEAGGYDLVSLMARLSCGTWQERALIPAFVFFFFMLYPPEWVARRRSRTAAAAGGCMLVRREALARIGGMVAIRGEWIDDCALARAIKQDGAIWLGPADEVRSVRAYSGWREIGGMISRSAFSQLHHSALLLLLTLAGMSLTFVVPPVLALAGGWPALCGAGAWLLMSLAYLSTLRYCRCSPIWALLLPAVAVFYMSATVHSAVQYWRGRGGLWKGRVQDSVDSE